MSVVSLDLAKAMLQVAGTDEDTLIQALLDGVESWVEGQWGVLLSQQEVEEHLFGGERCLWPTKVPVVSVSSVETEDGSSISSTSYAVRGNAIVHDDEWEPIWYVVAYTAGYSEIPASLESCILSLVRRAYDARGGAASERAGGHAVEWRALADTDEMAVLQSLAGGPPC